MIGAKSSAASGVPGTRDTMPEILQMTLALAPSLLISCFHCSGECWGGRGATRPAGKKATGSALPQWSSTNRVSGH